MMIFWLRPARPIDVAALAVGAGGFFVVLALVWLWDVGAHPSLTATVPWAVALLVAGALILGVGGLGYARARRESRPG